MWDHAKDFWLEQMIAALTDLLKGSQWLKRGSNLRFCQSHLSNKNPQQEVLESYSFPGVGGWGVEDGTLRSGGEPEGSGLIVADE